MSASLTPHDLALIMVHTDRMAWNMRGLNLGEVKRWGEALERLLGQLGLDVRGVMTHYGQIMVNVSQTNVLPTRREPTGSSPAS